MLVLVLSFLFGVAIEFAQATFTTSRKAEVADVIANLYGALAGICVIFVIQFLKPKKQ